MNKDEQLVVQVLNAYKNGKIDFSNVPDILIVLSAKFTQIVWFPDKRESCPAVWFSSLKKLTSLSILLVSEGKARKPAMATIKSTIRTSISVNPFIDSSCRRLYES